VPTIVGSRPEAGPGESPSVPEQMEKRLTLAGPLILVGLLVGGVLLIILWISFFAGLFVLAWGLLYGLFGFFRSVMVLCDGEKREVSGVAAPLLMILVALAAWCTAIHSRTTELVRPYQETCDHPVPSHPPHSLIGPFPLTLQLSSLSQ